MINDLYKHYLELGGNLDKQTFRTVCGEFNIRVMDKIIYDGYRFQMPFGIGAIQIIRVNRSFKKLRIDWRKSNAEKKRLLAEGKTLRDKENPDGENWLIYYTDDDFVKFNWEKKSCRYGFKVVMNFKPTRGLIHGNKDKLKKFLEKNPFAISKYKKHDN